MKVFCPNCGKETTIVDKDNVFKECPNCGLLLRLVKWKNNKRQLTGYLKDEL